MSDDPPRRSNKAVFSTFYDYLESSGGYTTQTVAVYKNRLQAFQRWLDANHKVFDALTKIDVAEYLSSYANYSPAYRKLQYQTLRGMFSWGVEFDLIQRSPVTKSLRPKLVKSLKPPLSVDQCMHLINTCPETPRGERDRIMLELLYSLGLRESEAAGLRLRDIHEGIAVIHGKGRKDRALPMPEHTRDRLERYLRDVRPLYNPQTDHVLVGRGGRPLKMRTINELVLEAAEHAGLQSETLESHGRTYHAVTSHTLRRSIATHLLEAGLPIEYVQDFLGHGDLRTTRVYAQIMRGAFARKLLEAHPLDHLDRLTHEGERTKRLSYEGTNKKAPRTAPGGV